MPYIGNPPAERFTSFAYQDLTGGSGTSFTLDNAVGNPQEIEVFVNNVRQEPGVAYTVSGTALTMTGSIASTDDFYVVFQGKAIQTATHPSDRALTATDGTFTGNTSVTGNSTVTGDLTVDTNTLHVDAANNRVAIGATSSVARLEIEDGGTSDSYLMKITADDQTPYAFMVGNDTYSSTDSNGFGFVQRNDGAAYIYNGGALRAALHSVSGGVLSVEGGVVLGAGAANSTTANTLDDYEEGTFNPYEGIGSAFTGESYGARYTKIGKVVHIDMRVLWTGTDNSGNPLVLKVPFSSVSSGNLSNTGVVLYSGTQLESGNVIISHLGTNNNEVNLYRGSGGSFHSVRRDDVNGSYDMLIAFTYEVP